MKFRKTPIDGAFMVVCEPKRDQRGFFARTFCREQFTEEGLEPCGEQTSISWSQCRGTLRGMHFQREPHGEAKLVTCLRGAIFDVLLDLREGSPNWGMWAVFGLRGDRPASLYVPRGVAHGFQTLTDDTLVTYQMSTPHVESSQDGVRFDDPAFQIVWPIANPIVSMRDRSHPLIRRNLACAS